MGMIRRKKRNLTDNSNKNDYFVSIFTKENKINVRVRKEQANNFRGYK